MGKNKGKNKGKEKAEGGESPGRMKRKDVEKELEKLQVEPTRLQSWVRPGASASSCVFYSKGATRPAREASSAASQPAPARAFSAMSRPYKTVDEKPPKIPKAQARPGNAVERLEAEQPIPQRY